MTTRPAPDLFQVMEDVQSVYIARRDMYKALVAAGHRRRDRTEERIIQSLETAASVVEKHYYDRRPDR